MSERQRDETGQFLPNNTIGPRWEKGGASPNPGGVPKTRKELRLLARKSLPLAFARAHQILESDNAEWRAWMEAGKFVASYSFSTHTKERDDDDSKPAAMELTIEELRALARRELRMERERNGDGPEH